MTYTYNRKGITRKVLSEIVRGLGAKDELKILKWQIRIIMEADAVYPYIVYMPKALRCFTILTLTLFLRCIFQIPPCVNRKIVATRKCSWHVCASCHYDVSSFPTYLQKQPHPLPA